MRKHILTLSLTAIAVVGVLIAQQPQQEAPPALPETPTGLARQEAIRREQATVEAREAHKRGEVALRAGKHDEAIRELEQAFNTMPRLKATEGDVRAIRSSLITALSRAANAALKAKEPALDAAAKHARRIGEIDSEHPEARRILAQIERQRKAMEIAAAPKPPPTRWEQDQAKIRTLLRDGEMALQTGQYKLAKEKFEEALEIDRHNAEAYRSLAALHKMRESVFEVAKSALSAERFAEASEAWLPVRRKLLIDQVERPAGPTVTDTAKINEKLKKIVIPEVDFKDTPISQVIDILMTASRLGDIPTNEGVNIIYHDPTPAATAAPVGLQPALPAPAAPGAIPGVAPLPGVAAPAATSVPPVTITMRNVPLIDLLNYITQGSGLRFRVEPHAVIISPATAVGPITMVTRTYKVVPGTFELAVTRARADTGQAGIMTAAATGQIRGLEGAPLVIAPADVRQFFEDAGVPFPEGARVTYNRSANALIATNTPTNLDTLERILEVINKSPPQVEIEARFVEVSQSTLNELGFKWQLGSSGWTLNSSRGWNIGNSQFNPTTGQITPGTQNPITVGLRDITAVAQNTVDALLASQNAFITAPGASNDEILTLAGIATNPQLQVTLKALAQSKDADLLSAPKITTTSGIQADIKIAREFIYPTDYTPAQATAAGGGTATGGAVAVVPATAGSFVTREVGVLLNVTPTVAEDEYTINLVIAPEVAEFDGFINYGGVIQVPTGVGGVANVDNPILQPIFSTRRVTTTLTIWDGQTVVMGGLIRDDRQMVRDKVPFLGDIPAVGRLFRTKIQSVVKRNLLIFVTASLINPDGTRKHKEVEPEEVLAVAGAALP